MEKRKFKQRVDEFYDYYYDDSLYSITNGIGMGVITYVVITFFSNILSAIKYKISKEKKEEDKPKWDISPVL